NESFRRRGSSMIASVALPESDVGSTDNAPAVNPARSRMEAMASEASGVDAAGLRIDVQPAAMAGATLRAPIAMGKFHGVISRQGPTGRLPTTIRPLPDGAGRWSPGTRHASSENHRKNSAA